MTPRSRSKNRSRAATRRTPFAGVLEPGRGYWRMDDGRLVPSRRLDPIIVDPPTYTLTLPREVTIPDRQLLEILLTKIAADAQARELIGPLRVSGSLMVTAGTYVWKLTSDGTTWQLARGQGKTHPNPTPAKTTLRDITRAYQKQASMLLQALHVLAAAKFVKGRSNRVWTEQDANQWLVDAVASATGTQAETVTMALRVIPTAHGLGLALRRPNGDVDLLKDRDGEIIPWQASGGGAMWNDRLQRFSAEVRDLAIALTAADLRVPTATVRQKIYRESRRR